MNQQQKDQDKRNSKTDDNCTKSLVGINQFKPEPPKESNNNDNQKPKSNNE